MSRSLLTQSEAAFLLSPSARAGADCVRAALLSLIAQGRIAIAEKSKPTASQELILGSDKGPVGLAPHTRVIEMVLREYRGGHRLSANEVLAALQKRFGYAYDRFVHDHIAPELIELGYVARFDTKWLGLFPRTRYELTARGQAVVTPLRRELASLEELPALVDANPTYALQLAHAAGVMLILSPIARRQIPRLQKLMTRREGEVGSVVVAGSEPAPGIDGFESHSWATAFEGCGLLYQDSLIRTPGPIGGGRWT